jgi:hypothetical protein
MCRANKVLCSWDNERKYHWALGALSESFHEWRKRREKVIEWGMERRRVERREVKRIRVESSQSLHQWALKSQKRRKVWRVVRVREVGVGSGERENLVVMRS